MPAIQIKIPPMNIKPSPLKRQRDRGGVEGGEGDAPLTMARKAILRVENQRSRQLRKNQKMAER